MSNIETIMTVAKIQSVCNQATDGANIVLEWERNCKVKKSCPHTIRKHTRMVGRIGLTYDNIAQVKADRLTGELPSENNGLPWGEWVEGSKYLVAHKGQFYVRLYKGTSKTTKPSVEFTRDGETVSKDEILDHLLASEKNPSKGETFVVKVGDILKIGVEIPNDSTRQEKAATSSTTATTPALA